MVLPNIVNGFQRQDRGERQE